MPDEFWSNHSGSSRGYLRAHNAVGRASLLLGDDSKGTQIHQIEGYPGEVRDDQQRYGEFGFSSMPLAGAKGAVTYAYGHRDFGTILGVEDPRYRPKGLKPGEMNNYMVDGAKADGTGGTMRKAFEALLGWIIKISGTTINIGQKADADADTTAALALFAKMITMGADGTLRINLVAAEKITITCPVIVLDAQAVKLGGDDASTPASMQGTIDSHGDTDIGFFATRVFMK